MSTVKIAGRFKEDEIDEEFGFGEITTFTWNLAADERGDPIVAGPTLTNVSFQIVSATPGGTPGQVSFEGSNVKTDNWFTLKDKAGTALSGITAEGGYSIGDDLPARFGPKVTGGDGTTAYTIVACVRLLDL